MNGERPVVAHLVTPYLFPTGSWIYDQVRSVERYRSLVVTSAVENPAAFPWDAIERLPAAPESRRAYGSPRAAWRAAQRRARLETLLRGAAVAHAHFGPEGFHAVSAARRAGTPLIVSFYGYDLTQLPERFPVWRVRYRRLFAAARAVLVEGGHMRDALIELGCPSGKATVQRLGVDLDAIPFRERRRAEPVKLLLAATFREKKGIPYALEALAESRRGGLDARLTLIGEGPEEARIASMIADLELDEAVERRGYVPHDELVAELDRHDILVQPSVTASDGDSEGGLPVIILEGAASGMPVLATTHCDIGEAVVHGRGGLLVPERDSRALAAGLDELARRAEEWPDMGAFNRSHIEARYDLKAQIRRLEEIYDGVRR